MTIPIRAITILLILWEDGVWALLNQTTIFRGPNNDDSHQRNDTILSHTPGSLVGDPMQHPKNEMDATANPNVKDVLFLPRTIKKETNDADYFKV
jgi:hypothetical protein